MALVLTDNLRANVTFKTTFIPCIFQDVGHMTQNAGN